MTTVDRILARIANMCMLNWSQLYKSDLTDGKMGAVAYLMLYSCHSGATAYYNDGELLLHTILRNKNYYSHTRSMAQIGLALDCLKLMLRPLPDPAAEVIPQLLEKVPTGQIPPFANIGSELHNPRFWTGFYLLSGLKDPDRRDTLLPLADKCLEAVAMSYCTKAFRPVSLTNSVFFFVNTLARQDIFTAKAKNTERLIERYLIKYMDNPGLYDPGEIELLKRLVATRGSTLLQQKTGIQVAAGPIAIPEGYVNPDDDLWREMIFPNPAGRPAFDPVQLEEYVIDKIDNFKAEILPKLISIGLYLLDFSMGFSPEN